jgi:hypothetical protein
MTKREAIRQTDQENTLLNLGFTLAEAEALRRISMTLHRWAELECGMDGGCIERDDTTNKPFWHNSHSGRLSPIADREAGALKRLKTIIADRNDREAGKLLTEQVEEIITLSYYVQGDPRGAALYIIRPDDVPAGADVSSYYNRGICVY